jgi:hypothetical protein
MDSSSIFPCIDISGNHRENNWESTDTLHQSLDWSSPNMFEIRTIVFCTNPQYRTVINSFTFLNCLLCSQ